MFNQEDLSAALKCFAQAVTNFLLSPPDNTKKRNVLHFNNHNSGSKHDFYHFLTILTSFFSSTLWALSVGLSHLCIPRTSKFHFRGPPFALYSVCKIHIYLPMIALWSLLIQTSFSCIKFTNLWYKTCFVPYLIPIWT